MKRRRLEVADANDNSRHGKANDQDHGASDTEKKKVKKEVNIQEMVRSRREAADEAFRRDEESLQQTLQDTDLEGMRSLAVVEEMEVLPRQHDTRASRRADTADDRWDDRWNGRKNFKKFRRSRRHGDDEAGGAPAVTRGAGQKVIVPLEEVRKKDFGIGEEYWLNEREEHRRKRKGKGKETASQGISQAQEDSEPIRTARSRATHEEAGETAGEDLMVADTAEMAGPPARRTRGAEKAGAAHSQLQTQTIQTQGTTSSRSQVQPGGSGKRPAATALSKGGGTKRQRTLETVRDSDSESDEDELKFRFRKRR